MSDQPKPKIPETIDTPLDWDARITQPKGEWTPEYVMSLMARSDRKFCDAIAEEHNAALATERKKTKDACRAVFAVNEGWKEKIKHQELKPGEVEALWLGGESVMIQQLRKQLDDERENTFRAIDLQGPLQQQLAAERCKGSTLIEFLAWLREELKADEYYVEKIDIALVKAGK